MSEPWYRTPGVHPEVTPEEYLRAPIIGGSVTSSVLRLMTPPEYTPAHARWYLDQDREPKPYYDVGSAYHTVTLGRGSEVATLDAPDWRSKDAREWRDRMYAEGSIPLLKKDADMVAAMRTATMAHPDCHTLFTPGTFVAELVIVWPDEATGLMCRAMLDAVPDYGTNMTLIDLKTKVGHADPASVSTSIARYGYFQQLAHYIAGCRTIGLAEEITPVLVVCGKEPPHVPLCRPVDEDAIAMGMVCNRKALDLYAECLATGEWPGYDAPGVERAPIGVPGWKRYQFQAAFDAGLYDVEEESVW